MIVFLKIFTGITISPSNPDPKFKEAMGWKHYNGSSMCKGSGKNYINCHENYTYSENDIFTESYHSLKLNASEPDPDYNFGHCVDRSVIRFFECQPPWRRVDIKDLPICDNSMILQKYSHYYFWLTTMGKDELVENTNCITPCSFMEYKVAMAIYSLLKNVALFR